MKAFNKSTKKNGFYALAQQLYTTNTFWVLLNNRAQYSLSLKKLDPQKCKKKGITAMTKFHNLPASMVQGLFY